jgi:hypothetical protein
MPSCLRRMFPALLVGITLALTLGAAPADAAATGPTPLGGRAWNVKVIRLYDTTPAVYREGINLAIQSWNARHVGVTFVRTSVRSRAHVVVGTALYPGNVEGKATLGMTRGAWIRLDTGLVATEPLIKNGVIYNLPGGAVPEHVAVVMAHEMGHVLGLSHTTGCSLMLGPNARDTCPVDPPKGSWSCRLQQARDVLAASRRYHGHGTVQVAKLCRLSATRAGRVGKVTVSPTTRSSAYKLSWREVTNSFGYRVARSAAGGPCPSTPVEGERQLSTTSAEHEELWASGQLPKVAATYCVSIWSVNGRGTLTGPTTRSFTVTPPGTAPVSDLQASVVGSSVNFSWTSPAGTRVVRVYRSNEPGATACAVPPFTPIVQALGAATSATEDEVPSGTWTYAVTRSDDPADDGDSDGPPEWASAPVCVTVTVA